MSILDYILSAVAGFGSLGFTIYILSKFLYKKPRFRPLLICVLVAVSSVTMLYINTFRIPVVNFLSVNAIQIIITHILFKGNFALKLGFSVILTAIVALSEDIILFITMVFSQLGWSAVTENPVFTNISGFLTLSIFIVIGRTIARFFPRKYTALRVHDMFLVAFQIIATVGESFMVLTVDTSQMPIATVIFYILLQIALLASAILIFFIYDSALHKRELEQQIELYKYQFDQIKSSQAVIGKIQHDMDKHLLALKLDLKNAKPDEAEQKIDKLIGNMHLETNAADSGDADIDAILNYKAKQAQEFGIRMVCDLRLPYTLNMNTTDLTIIFGNAIDNAIEACRNVEAPERVINIAAIYEKSNLRITIDNPFAGELNTDSAGELVTSKRDGNHGIGLNNIKETVIKYDGLMDIATDNNIFVLKIMLFNLSSK